ncbi:MAG: 5'-methylthioadenosine/S-adenosylhomocysteine nucleosidase [Clostridia bacterium]|nr:5'-methylthioadenosine/S-adenosylhomocysteine nucleosidase [Clostridia bacterium]
MTDNIGIVTALADESVYLRQCFGTVINLFRDGGYTVYQYKFADKNIFMINCGVGEIAAALATQYLIFHYNVGCLLNVGLVGSLCDEYKRGQLVAVKEIVHYDFTRMYSDDEIAGIHMGHESFVLSFDTPLLDNFVTMSQLPAVRIASGDKFVDVTALKLRLADKFGCEICDMESAGIHFACVNSNVPYIMIKCVSDNADEGANESFYEAIDGGVKQYVDYVKKFIINL